MDNRITIVMYHYVRDLSRSRYPEIKGLTVNAFRRQLDYIREHYTIISMEDMIDSLRHGYRSIPDNALLLTFDDGYLDHFTTVFPILHEAGIQGSFFPSAKAVQEQVVLDVNKIHFILATVKDKREIISFLFKLMDEFRNIYNLDENEIFFKTLAVPNRFDSGEVIFIKRMLQRVLPVDLRKKIIDMLFKKFVTNDEEAFSQELYLNIDHLRCMKRCGMFIGSHGYDHHWLDTLSPENQDKDIDRSLQFLQTIGVSIEKWVMCYPYGAYNKSLLEIIRRKGCALGLSVQVGIADLSRDDVLTLPRLDTNDIPMSDDSQRGSSILS